LAEREGIRTLGWLPIAVGELTGALASGYLSMQSDFF
jgi:hypothetical protein